MNARHCADGAQRAPARMRRACALGLPLALAAGLLAGFPGAVKAHGGHHRRPRPTGYQRLDADEPAPDFALTDQNGHGLSLARLRGKSIAMTFLFTQCADTCPLIATTLESAAQMLSPAERAEARFVGITVDPKRDTPARLRAFMKTRGLDAAHWSMLTGSVARATQVATDYGVVVRPDPMLHFVHNTVFVLIDARGHLRIEFHGVATPPADIANALREIALPTKG